MPQKNTTKILKKNGELQTFNGEKIKRAIRKSADRVCITLTPQDEKKVVDIVRKQLQYNEVPVPVSTVHNMVECALDNINPVVAKSYREYRDNKSAFASMLDKVYNKKLSLNFIGDRSNANADSALVTTQKAITYNELNSELYKKFFLNRNEERAMSDGYIYIHDRGSRLDSMNCFRRDTRFITKDGIKSFYDFSDGDETIVLSHTGVWRRAIVHKYGWQPIQKVTFKKGTPTSKPTEVYCTKNHRWILKNSLETTDLKIGDVLYQIPDITLFDWDKLSLENKKLWCRGFAKGDGSLIGSPNQNRPTYVITRLCDEKTKYAQRFIDCGYSVTNFSNDSNDLLVHMLDTNTKDIPFLSLNYTNVIYYINGLMCADGHKTLSKNASSEFRGIQVTGELNKYIYDLLNMAGYFVTSTQDLTGTKTNYGIRNKETIKYQVSSTQNRNSAWRVSDIQPEKLNPKAEVWCLEVDVDHSFVLEGGIPTGNCCLFDMPNVLKDGFQMGNLEYSEPKTLDVAFDLIADISMNAAACQYGGFSLSEIDKLLAPYAEKSYKKYYNEYRNIVSVYDNSRNIDINDLADRYALKKVERDFEQGFQGWEMKFNSVASSRGDYPFTSISFGLGTKRFETMASSICLRVRKNGQGKNGFKHPVLFPKLSFFYDESLHGKDKELEWLFDEAIDCSSKSMYPDYISCTGDGYAPSIYKKYGKTISRMGCRANLSPWFERGGMFPEDNNDQPIYEGRFNLGAISLHFPMIVAKAQQENKDFYEVLTYYLDMCRDIHKRTFNYLSHKKAGTNPLGFCQGGFLNGNFDPEDEIGEDFLRPMTMSFGITALNEASVLYTGKSIVEDNTFAIEVLKFMNEYADKYKVEDNILYALYGTPAESLCGLQIEQFKKKYGILKGVSDRPYTTNSFHCGVWEDITPIEKQDIEHPMFHLCNGGNIQYCRYPIDYNIEAIKTLVRRAMDMGFYEGVNLQLDYCEKCGHQFIDNDTCPKCGSDEITRIERMNGYLGYSKVNGRTMYADHKLEEFKDRVSM